MRILILLAASILLLIILIRRPIQPHPALIEFNNVSNISGKIPEGVRHHMQTRYDKLQQDANADRAMLIGLFTAASFIVMGPIAGIIGGAGTGLAGAAATSHGLAMLGFGSLASGGLGMAGGTIIYTLTTQSLINAGMPKQTIQKILPDYYYSRYHDRLLFLDGRIQYVGAFIESNFDGDGIFYTKDGRYALHGMFKAGQAVKYTIRTIKQF